MEFFLISLQDKVRKLFICAYDLISCEKSLLVRRIFPEQTDVYYSYNKLTTEVSKVLWQWK